MIRVKYTRYKPQGAYLRLSDEYYILDVDDRSGAIKGLYLQSDEQGTNFAGNEQNMRLNTWWKKRHVSHKALRTPIYAWTGDMVFQVRGSEAEAWRPMHTFLSEDVRRVRYDDRSITTIYAGDSANAGGLRGLALEQTYRLSQKAILWSIAVRNPTSTSLHIGEFGLPVILNNNHYQVGDEKQGFNHRSVDTTRYVYEQRVVDRFFVSGHSSYILATRPSGRGDHLLILPQGHTALEAVASDGLLPDTAFMKVTGSVFYLYSAATARQAWYNGHRSLTLSPGEVRNFEFKICRARDYADIDEKLYQNGSVAVKVAPGMVLPKETTGHLLLRCRKPITGIEPSAGMQVEAAGAHRDRHRYRVRLSATGQQRLTVRYGQGEWMNLWFNGIEPIETLIKARARFIVDHQRVLDPEDICQYSFRIWNNHAERLATEEEAPCGIVDMGGSNERCFAPPVFLSGKNVYYPDENEIAALDQFVERFLYGKLQDKESFQVLNCLIGPRPGSWRRWDYPWRIYNYPHVYNIYFNLYCISRLYQVKLGRRAREYLNFAYRTALASYQDSTYESIYETKNYLDYHRGNMSKTHAPLGSPTLALILPALLEEGMKEEHRILSQAIAECLPFFVEEEYPFATEYCFGQASHAAVYYLGQVAGDERLQRTTVETILACRDFAPMWPLYATNRRYIGCYPTPLLARPLLDRYSRSGDDFLLRMAYGAILAVWSCVDPSGKGYNGREWRFNPPGKNSGSPEYNYYRNGCFSGELGMGLHGVLSMLRAYLVEDGDFGLVGYGCQVEESTDDYVILPRDGLGVRAVFEPLGLEVEAVKGKMERIAASKDKRRIEVDLRRPCQSVDSAHIRVRGLEPGDYHCTSGERGEMIRGDGEVNWEGRYEGEAMSVALATH